MLEMGFMGVIRRWLVFELVGSFEIHGIFLSPVPSNKLDSLSVIDSLLNVFLQSYLYEQLVCAAHSQDAVMAPFRPVIFSGMSSITATRRISLAPFHIVLPVYRIFGDDPCGREIWWPFLWDSVGLWPKPCQMDCLTPGISFYRWTCARYSDRFHGLLLNVLALSECYPEACRVAGRRVKNSGCESSE